MAHEIEKNEATGAHSFVSANGLPAWHRLGTVIPDGATADQVLDLASLRGWDVQKVQNRVELEQVTADGVTVEAAEVPGSFTVTRVSPFSKRREPIGDPSPGVGKSWTPYQNEQAVEFLAAVTDQYSDARYETAGSIRLGAQVFVSIWLKDFLVGGVDGMKLYLTYLLNHLTGANQAYISNVRPVCANTVTLGLANARYTFRHTSGIADKHAEAREALQMAWNYDTQFQGAAEAMIREQMTLEDFRQVCDTIWPEPKKEEAPATQRRWEERRATLKQLFLFSDTQEGIRNTRWGAFNAITEWADHQSPVSSKLSAAEASEARALRTIDGGPKAGDGKTAVKLAAFSLLAV